MLANFVVKIYFSSSPDVRGDDGGVGRGAQHPLDGAGAARAGHAADGEAHAPRLVGPASGRSTTAALLDRANLTGLVVHILANLVIAGKRSSISVKFN